MKAFLLQMELSLINDYVMHDIINALIPLVMFMILPITMIGIYRYMVRQMEEDTSDTSYENGNTDKYKASKNQLYLRKKILSTISLLKERDAKDSMIPLLVSILNTSKKIEQFIFEHPDRIDSLRRYSNYYLPMLIKILDKFIDSLKYARENSAFRDEVQSALEDTHRAFLMIIDNLSKNMEMEGSCEIKAYKFVLEMDGVKGDFFTYDPNSDNKGHKSEGDLVGGDKSD
ncbi:5-bromo-4-chloroindolyl phosphate hydrolysis family protein [Eubacterium callanderi]|nr:5-bromo-4-chloroindolyl phosphate hydrolysis family protein [Eubacterium callanderi]